MGFLVQSATGQLAVLVVSSSLQTLYLLIWARDLFLLLNGIQKAFLIITVT